LLLGEQYLFFAYVFLKLDLTPPGIDEQLELKNEHLVDTD